VFVPRAALGTPLVWAADDGEKVKESALTSPLARGENNPIWHPGAAISLFAARNETIAFQVVITNPDEPLSQVTVDLDALTDETGTSIRNVPTETDPSQYVGRPIERFVEHFIDVARPSGGKTKGESLGWAAGSGPADGAFTGRIPDALIPTEVAPVWRPYPMTIAARSNAIVWFDITVGPDLPPGTYRGTVRVRARDTALESMKIELQVLDFTLPDRPVRTMLFYGRSELERRMGMRHADAAEAHLWRLLHRHRIAPLHIANTAEDVVRHSEALNGSAYTRDAGYEGPATSIGDGVLAIGMYGSLGAPDDRTLKTVEKVAVEVATQGLEASTDTFVYAIDEDCGSPLGKRWKALLDRATTPALRHVRVAWTCSEPAANQPVDIPIQAGTFDIVDARRARSLGKEVWAYNGRLPHSGTFLMDAPATSPRVNGWLSAIFHIGRWFYWESTFWYDDNRGGHGATDPYVNAETFHNANGDYAMGDGTLLYPGIQTLPFMPIQFSGIIASIRLKNWRRGVEDAAYYQLAHAQHPAEAERIATTLIPVALGLASDGQTASWKSSGQAFFDARRALSALISPGTEGGAGEGASPGWKANPKQRAFRDDDAAWRVGSFASLALLSLALLLLHQKRRKRA
jgi:hypothetical protein